MNAVLDLYNSFGTFERFFLGLPGAKSCCSKRARLLDGMYFKRRWLQVEQACEPSDINW